jgi:pimeloyl-ACP methyl ester carboxylesterase
MNCLAKRTALQMARAIKHMPMNDRPRGLGSFAVLFLLSWVVLCSQAQAPQHTSPLATASNTKFVSETASVNGITLHYVRVGSGPAVILIHGFPRDWYEYHAIMPQLAKQFTVIAIDLPGVGGSTAKPGGYDAASVAEDIHQLVGVLKLSRVYVVGQDIGGMATYAFFRRFPEATRGAMILDCPIPGIAGWDEFQGNPATWHVRFMQVPGLAEKLVAGRQADYFGYFYNFGKFTPGDVAHSLKSYATLAQLHAMFEMYRAFPLNAEFNAAQRSSNAVPLLLAAGDRSIFAPLLPKIAEGLRANGCSHVETTLIQNAVHYLIEDQPDAVTGLIEQYASLNTQ